MLTAHPADTYHRSPSLWPSARLTEDVEASSNTLPALTEAEVRVGVPIDPYLPHTHTLGIGLCAACAWHIDLQAFFEHHGALVRAARCTKRLCSSMHEPSG